MPISVEKREELLKLATEASKKAYIVYSKYAGL